MNLGSSRSWDDTWVSWPVVIHDGTQFIMYYTGFPVLSPVGAQVGRATSPDGIIWTRELGNPVLKVGSEGEWDGATVTSGPIIFDGSEYKMWFGGYDGIQYRNGLATSPDGIVWTKYEENPVFVPGESGQWDDSGVALTSVIFDESVYKIWYVGREDATGIWRVGYATSSDGITWDRNANNPVLDVGESGEWDDEDIENVHVLFNGKIYEMWYQGNDGSIMRSGYATSPVIINVPDQVETIQAAIDSAVDGNLVLVDEGTYYENINFMGKAITVASRFYVDGDTSHISNTIIDGSQHEHPDSGSVVYFVSGEDTNSVLCGFTITVGSGTKGIYNNNDTWDGGGIYCASGGRIINNIVRNNVVHSDNSLATAGGIEAGWDGKEYVIIENNTISSNTVYGTAAGSGGIGFYCSGRIINNTVVDNAITAFLGGAMGGGIQCYGDIFISVDVLDNHIENNQVSATASGNIAVYSGGLHFARANGNISNNVIKNNSIKSTNDAYGGGIFINTSQTSTVANNLISNNSVEGTGDQVRGGGMNYSSQFVAGKTTIYNNIIVYNEAINGHGGGISFGSDLNDDALIINNTIAYNKAGYFGGAIATRSNQVGVMLNSILWGNQAQSNSHIYPGDGSTLDVLYSDIQSGYSGEGNIDQDPLFEDSVSFKLSEASPCIGAGIDSIEISGTWFYCPDQCYYCMPRPNPVDEYVDIGAAESPYPKVTGGIEDEEFFMPQTFKLGQNYPNPFNPNTKINYQLPMTSDVELSIYNLLGQKVVILVSERKQAGSHQVEWDASNQASGVYFYRIEAGEFQDVKKMILLR